MPQPAIQPTIIMATKTHIPLPYIIYMKWMDPIVSVMTAYAAIFNRDETLALFNPVLSPRDPNYDCLLWMTGGGFMMIAIMQGLLLRYTNDVNVWKISNLGVLVVDLSITGAMLEMFQGTGQLATLDFKPKDLFNLFMTLVAIVMRVAFIAGIGLKSASKSGGKKKQ